jgi:TolA-binding protein
MGSAVDVSAIVPTAKVAAPAPVAQPSTAPARGADTATAAGQKAASALQMANDLVKANRFDAARQRLKEIIDTYPETPAAKQARSVLDQIKNK